MIPAAEQSMHNNIRPPITIPAQAMGWPDSFLRLIEFSAITPNIRASNPVTTPTGKQMTLVNGNGITPVQTESRVNTARIRLTMDCRLAGL